MDPLISVIVPVYKVEAYLESCVSSIREQTYQNLEIILVDDGSPDHCGALCDKLAAQDPRIRVLHKENGGLSSARNAGLDAMTGELVAFVDSDDRILPEMIETLYRRMVEEDAQISCCGMGKYKNGTLVATFNPNTEEKRTFSAEEALADLLGNSRITNSVCDKLYRVEIFQGLRMKTGVVYEDMQVQPYCIDRARRVTYTGEPLYCYALSEGSILRGGYSLRHYDLIRHSLERIAYYREHHPRLAPAAEAAHLTLCLDSFVQSFDSPEWKEKREELARTVCRKIPAEVKPHCGKRLLLKRQLLKLHPRMLMAAEKLYRATKKQSQ